MEACSYVDAHCHVDLYPDYKAVICEAELGSTRVLAVTTTPRAYRGNVERVGSSNAVTVGLGLHPQVVGTLHDDLPLFDKLVESAAAIGEVGLDASPKYYRTLDAQRQAFGHIISKAADAGGKPVSIHAVRTVPQVLNIISQNDPRRSSRYAIHWFSGNLSELRRAIDLDCYFSVNIAMSRSANGSKVLRALPRDRVFTETDGPFIEDGGVALRPQNVRSVIDVLAEIWGTSHAESAAVVLRNFSKFMAG